MAKHTQSDYSFLISSKINNRLGVSKIMKKILIKDIINNSKVYRESKYIRYFFNNIAQIKSQEPVFETIKDVYDVRVSIIKDSTSRILDNEKGKLMERTWRNCVFYFVDKKTYVQHFGTNDYYPNYSVEGGKVYFDGTFNQVNSKLANDPKIHWDIIKGFQDTMFNYFKKAHSSWFVRSYVYFIMVICDEDSLISDKDYHIYYWNTKYQFKRLPSKRNIFNNVADSFFVENVQNEIKLIETTNRDVIECVKAYNGDLDFRNKTEENYIDISRDLNDGVNFILIRGAARTGKTIIAMRVLGNYKNSVFLIMNYYFYVALKEAYSILDVEFPKNRIYHHDLKHRYNGCWINNLQTKEIIPNLEFLIVDEAQRLARVPMYINYYENYSLPGIDEIDTIINYPNQKHTIFLGDDLQKLNPGYDRGFSLIHEKISEKNFREYYFKSTIGIPLEILENIRYILDIPNGSQVQPTNEFTFVLSKSSSEFVTSFDTDETIKKHFVCVGLKQTKGQSVIHDERVISEYPQELKDKEYPYFFNDEIKPYFLLSTYEVISREIESVYLYLPEIIEYDLEQDSIRFSDDRKLVHTEFLINHIYTLMTRATLKLTIFCENESLNAHFSSKIDYINEINTQAQADSSISNPPDVPDETDVSDDEYDYDVFIAYHGTNNPNGSYAKAKEICDYLKLNKLRVFLNDYSSNSSDTDLGFNETRNVIQRSNKFLLVFNDNIPRDRFGMIPRKYSDNTVNQLYTELMMFTSLVDDDLRTNKNQLKFFYDGSKYTRSNIYSYLNKLYRAGTTGNSSVCYFTFEEVLAYALKK